MIPHDPFHRTPARHGFDRADRVRLLAEAADALLRGELPSPAARLYLAGAVAAWLEQGGSLTGQYLRVDAERGSHLTPWALFRRLRGAPEDADALIGHEGWG